MMDARIVCEDDIRFATPLGSYDCVKVWPSSVNQSCSDEVFYHPPSSVVMGTT